MLLQDSLGLRFKYSLAPPGEDRDYIIAISGAVHIRNGTLYINARYGNDIKSDRGPRHPARTLRSMTMTVMVE